jgi:ATP synthase I chain
MQRFTLATGCAASLATAALKSPRWGIGIAIGTVLAWLNFRWLDQGVSAIVVAAQAQEGEPKPKVPPGTFLKFVLRYALIGVAAYVTVVYFAVPVVAVVTGLLALGAAAVIEGLFEIISRRN